MFHAITFGRRLQNRSLYAIGPLPVCPVCLSVMSCLSVTFVYCGQTVGWIKMKLGKEVGLGPGLIVSDGKPAPPKSTRQFSAYVRCVQTDGWIKMSLGKEVGLDPGNIVLDGDPAPYAKKVTAPPNFWPMSLVAKRLDGSRCHLVRR